MPHVHERRIWTRDNRDPFAPIVEDPIAEGLVALFCPGLFREAVQKTAPSVLSALPYGGESGIGAEYGGGTINSQWAHLAPYAQTGACTVLALLDVDTLTNYSGVIAKQGSTTTNAPYEFRLGAGTTGSELHIVRATGSDYRAFNSLSNRISAPARGVLTGFSFADGTVTTTPTIYCNESSYAGSAVGGSASGSVTDNGSTVWIGRRSDGATYLDGRIYWIAIWSRVIRASEYEAILRNKRRLIAPEIRATFYSLGGAGAQTITGAGNIASLEAFGSTVVAPGAIAITGAGAIATAEAFGTQQLNLALLTVGGITSLEAFGSATVAPGVFTITGAGAIATAEAFGSAAVSAGGSFITGAGNIASAEAFGSATLAPGGVSIVGAGAIASAEAFGDALVSAGGSFITGAGNIASAEAFGSAALAVGAFTITGAGAIASAEAFGSGALQHGTLQITGAGAIASAEAFGDALIPGGATYILGAGNIASAEAFGPVPLIPQNYTPGEDRVLEVPGGDRVLEVPGGDRVLRVPGGGRILEVRS